MLIGIPAEVRPGETRVAATPETVKKLAALGHHKLLVQSGAGVSASVPDSQYADAGATIAGSGAEVYARSDIVLKVRAPLEDELAPIRQGTILVGLLNPYDAAGVEACARRGLTGLAMEWLPRITRAQAMDVLSSMSIPDHATDSCGSFRGRVCRSEIPGIAHRSSSRTTGLLAGIRQLRLCSPLPATKP